MEAAIRAREQAEREEEERRKRSEELKAMERSLVGSSQSLLEETHQQSQTLHETNLARFNEERRIERLPFVYREATRAEDKDAYAQYLWSQPHMLLPIYIVEGPEHWVVNAQACMILMCPHDLDLQNFPDIERRPATDLQKTRFASVFHGTFGSFGRPRPLDFDPMEEYQRQEAEKDKFIALDNIFLIKSDDLHTILNSNERYRFIVDKWMKGGKLPGNALAVSFD
ncbi:hypothetical protein ABW21_db0206799 [Orbilia brochopaga]|nr:hypothetical protein ABW21_db0206799 [Drechslerella brochopaga]